MKPAYYNENNPYAAQWLRNLIAGGHIAAGDVDERSITDVRADDLRPYTQCHFFAGVGAWSYALRLAGWPDDRPVWTGSCPCQPFSIAGAGKGVSDERHLWPVWYKLIRERQPTVVFGEQVEAAIRHGWLDLVQDDLESSGYTFGAICLPAACTGAPHIRQRAWFVADAQHEGSQGGLPGRQDTQRENINGYTGCNSPVSVLADAKREQCQEPLQRPGQGNSSQGSWQAEQFAGLCGFDSLANTDQHSINSQNQTTNSGDTQSNRSTNLTGGHGLSLGGFWDSADWLYCRDGKYRPVESGTFPLAHGATARVGRLCAYGNAIVAQTAAEVISAYMVWRASA